MAKTKEDKFIELLSEEEICELHEAFNIFDEESDGSIEGNNLVILLNSLNQYPKKEEIVQMLKDIGVINVENNENKNKDNIEKNTEINNKENNEGDNESLDGRDNEKDNKKNQVKRSEKYNEVIYNGPIYFNQFLKIMAKRLKDIKKDEDKYLKSLFRSLDRNNNGLISIHEIRYIVTHSSKAGEEKISEDEIELIMKEADTDGDGLISLEEFLTIMKN